MTTHIDTGRSILRRLDAERSCGAKHRHGSARKAAAHIASIAARYGEDAAAGLVAYPCRFSRPGALHYHVGHRKGDAHNADR